jgi:hypothetical protein
MKVRFSTIDREIQQLEQRIADDRAAFVAALGECGQSLRETASSPKTLLAVAGLGFVAGKLMFRQGRKTTVVQPPPPPSRLGGLLGLLGAGLSLMQPGSSTGGIARWAMQQFWDHRKKASADHAGPGGTVPRGRAAGAGPQVRTPLRDTDLTTATPPRFSGSPPRARG